MRLIKRGGCVASLLQVIDVLKRPTPIEILKAAVSVSMRRRPAVARQGGESMSGTFLHGELQGSVIAIAVWRPHIEEGSERHRHIWKRRDRSPGKSGEAGLGHNTPLLIG